MTGGCHPQSEIDEPISEDTATGMPARTRLLV